MASAVRHGDRRLGLLYVESDKVRWWNCNWSGWSDHRSPLVLAVQRRWSLMSTWQGPQNYPPGDGTVRPLIAPEDEQ